jgi:hypothetical protein
VVSEAADAPILLRSLRGMVERGAVRLDLDYARLAHIDSPVAVEADGNLWIYGGVILCAAIFYAAGWQFGLAAIVLCLLLYLTAGRAYIRARLRRRLYEKALQESQIWRRLWHHGGVVLVVESGGGEARCVAPTGNWMALVRELAAQGGISAGAPP